MTLCEIQAQSDKLLAMQRELCENDNELHMLASVAVILDTLIDAVDNTVGKFTDNEGPLLDEIFKSAREHKRQLIECMQTRDRKERRNE